jgi:hypothetical protein
MSQEREISLDDTEEEIARVREARHRISERFGHDPYRLVNYYIEKQKEHKDRLVRAPEPGEPDY